MTKAGRYVALALLLISPWPVVAVDWRRQMKPDLAAVPSNGRTLESPVSSVFSRGRYFQIANFSTGNVAVISNPYRLEQHAAGLRSAYLLLDQRVGIVIARHIGPEPFHNLTARGVQVFTGQPTTVMEALVQLRQGLLSRADAPNVKIHYGLERQGINVPAAPDCPLAGPPPPPSPPTAR